MSLMTNPLHQPEIVHGISGRLRIRVPRLHTNPDLKVILETQVKATPMVETVRISAVTDSVIVNYRSSTQEKIYQLICQITETFFAPGRECNPQELSPVSPPEPTIATPEPEVIPTVPAPAPETIAQTADIKPKPVVTDSAPETIESSAPETTDTPLPELLDPEPAEAESEPVPEAPVPIIEDGIDEVASPVSDQPDIPAATTPPATKSPRRTNSTPRKPRTRKKPEPPLNS
ncbi:hypothetical protein GlitD10_0369 [Gloeomargarita lithophora Alchichica-D10]|uniref:Uncharacterized protein n=1 Tax=Gloeomargarita lithophora Alchichica-D10 TaxID=1188229 RepID=A0A1J0A9T3_9CYAN|nr:hypothetical protein [Gloeomargarita lithophora]APB32679.1 hypothetical protein GlitD10_0369 [Gloeomargarita lithophora Alchichica-D10]